MSQQNYDLENCTSSKFSSLQDICYAKAKNGGVERKQWKATVPRDPRKQMPTNKWNGFLCFPKQKCTNRHVWKWLVLCQGCPSPSPVLFLSTRQWWTPIHVPQQSPGWWIHSWPTRHGYSSKEEPKWFQRILWLCGESDPWPEYFCYFLRGTVLPRVLNHIFLMILFHYHVYCCCLFYYLFYHSLCWCSFFASGGHKPSVTITISHWSQSFCSYIKFEFLFFPLFSLLLFLVLLFSCCTTLSFLSKFLNASLFLNFYNHNC